MLKIFLASICLLTITPIASAADEEPQPASGGISRIVNFPDIGIERSAELGNSIVSKARLYVYPAIVMSEPSADTPNSPGTTKISSGILPLYKISREGKFYRDPKAMYSMLGADVPIAEAGIFVPNDKSKPSVVYHYRPGGLLGLGKGYTFGEKPIAVPEETLAERWSQDSFKSELVYSGVSTNVVVLLYREYKNDIARPAFSQELKYDLGEGTVIGYKGARFEVTKATNTELQYKVVRHME